jgi:hypothetical protein
MWRPQNGEGLLMKTTTMGFLAFALAGLAGCVETDTTTSTAPMRMAGSADEAACLAAVAAQTNNTGVVLESITSEANNMVTIGVGPAQAKWQCLVKNGVVAQTMSMTNEGTL